MSESIWTTDNLRYLVCVVAACDTKAELDRAYRRLSLTEGWPSVTAIERKLWGMLTQYNGWSVPEDWEPLPQGTGQATYGEIQMIKTALNKGEVGVDRDHIAKVIGRSRGDVDEFIRQFGPAKGRPGLLY